MVFTGNKNNKNIKNSRSNKNSESNKNNNITDKLDFIEYSASRYGIDFSTAETFVDMFSDCLSELLNAGQSVEIDGVGTFEKLPLFPNGLNHRNNIALARVAKKKMVSFKASKSLVA
jgi:nucleoid DNA-binding protein